MVISFSSVPARTHLLENGFVYTFRKKRRKQFEELCPAFQWVCHDWANEGRGKPKFSDVLISEIGELQVIELSPYVNNSGFHSMMEWGKEIARLNQWSEVYAYEKGWLYKVSLFTTKGEKNED